MEGLIMAAQLILGLSILVTLHELGHFIPAKLFKTKVDKFYLFFDFLFPRQDLLNFSLFKIKKGDTEYGIGWFPLGGYVKINGMIDESMDKEFLKSEPKPYEYRSKKVWQKLIIMLGGVFVNLVTGVVIFIALTYYLGENYLPAKEAKYGIVTHELAEEIGLKTGDKILKINGKEMERFYDHLDPDVFLESGSYYTIDRNGTQMDVFIPSDFINKLSDKKYKNLPFIDPAMPFKVGKVVAGFPAEKAGLKADDIITAIDSTKISFFHELQKVLTNKKSQNVTISILRNNQPMALNCQVNEEGKLGFEVQSLLKYETHKFGLLESMGKGTVKAFSFVVVQAKGFKKLFSGDIDPSKSLSGPIGMAQQFGGNWDWIRFWTLTGLLSMVLAFMNLLPIPALDGGHALFLCYELISGRKPSDKFYEISQRIGMAILLSLMVFAIFNDVIRLF
ncbi:MAG: RIP metalloprotease RseP [Bacteroidetes bacterium]|nr:MAG: RIP metalloprotease RseP [Bacteroidota bacterium]